MRKVWRHRVSLRNKGYYASFFYYKTSNRYITRLSDTCLSSFKYKRSSEKKSTFPPNQSPTEILRTPSLEKFKKTLDQLQDKEPMALKI